MLWPGSLSYYPRSQNRPAFSFKNPLAPGMCQKLPRCVMGPAAPWHSLGCVWSCSDHRAAWDSCPGSCCCFSRERCRLRVADLVKDCVHVRDVSREQRAFQLCWRIISTSVLASEGRVRKHARSEVLTPRHAQRVLFCWHSWQRASLRRLWKDQSAVPKKWWLPGWVNCCRHRSSQADGWEVPSGLS